MTASPQLTATVTHTFHTPSTVRITQDGTALFDGLELSALARFQPALRSASKAMVNLPGADLVRVLRGEAESVTVLPGADSDPSRVQVAWRQSGGTR